MKKSLFIILVLCALILLFSCNSKNPTNDDAGSAADNDIMVESDSSVPGKNSKTESSDVSNDISKEPDYDKGVDNMNDFVLKGVVKGYNTHLEIEVIESDYAFGIYWVIVPNSTPILDKNGSNIELSSLKEGDIVEITYNGQTMMSYPPQIVSLKIVRT